METAMVEEGSTIALSATMPGLVGATFRRRGILAGFCGGITHRTKAATSSRNAEGKFKIKLFNMAVKELGPLNDLVSVLFFRI